MLHFKNGNTEYTVEANELIASRLISSKLYCLHIKLNNTIEDLGIKVRKVNELSDELFTSFATIGKDTPSWVNF